MERRRFVGSLGSAMGGALLTGSGRLPDDVTRSYGDLADALADIPDQEEDRYWELIRSQFLFPEDYHYLNTGGLGSSPWSVINRMKEMSDREDARPNAGHDLNHWRETKEMAAELLGPRCRQEELAFTSTATEGINIILNGLPLERGDEIITSTHEHPALNTPLINLAHRKGVVVRTFEPDLERGENNVREIEQIFTRRTRLIFISHLTCTTGQFFPVKEIGAFARSWGLWYALDGVQAIGAGPIDVREIDVDFYAVSGHKWMLGPRRTGILYVKEERLDELTPTVVGTYSDQKQDLATMTLEFQPTAQRYEFGTQNDALFYGLAEATGFVSTIGVERIRDHNRRLSELFVAGLNSIPGATVLSPAEEQYRSAMITFRLENMPYREVTAALGRKGFRVRPVGEVGLDAVRVSFHIYNNESEVEGVLDEIRTITE
ncbi:aminotransferase class V-fold PLP-dependent enzyme [Gemmatimonadota bacterium]